MDTVIRDVLDAVERQDWPQVRVLLHPYLHWTEAGLILRGRNKVLALLAGRAALRPPVSYEVRDGQIYRWNSD